MKGKEKKRMQIGRDRMLCSQGREKGKEIRRNKENWKKGKEGKIIEMVGRKKEKE